MFQREISITRIANGWLLRVPQQSRDIMSELGPQLPGIIRAYKGIIDDEVDPVMQKIRRESEDGENIYPPVVRGMFPAEQELHYFAKIDEVFEFIKKFSN